MGEVNTKGPLSLRVAALALCAGVGAFLARAVLAIPETESGLAPVVDANLATSGVKSVVTAVLLNFRGYDTLLEIAVVALATIGVLSLRVTQAGTWAPLAARAEPVLSALARFLAPVMILVAGYLLWAGGHAPGGAFQAGSIIGAAGVLLSLSGYNSPEWVTRFALRATTSVGFIVFLAIAIGGMFASGMFLEYPVDHAKTLILVIETWLTVSIGATLTSLFIASASPAEAMRLRSEGDE